MVSRGSFDSAETLRKDIKRFIKAHNEESRKPFNWKKLVKSVLAAVSKTKLVE